MNRIVYRPEAVSDVEAAFEWYEEKRSGLGWEFMAELATAEKALIEYPTAFRVIRKDVRRYNLRRFPYHVLYRMLGEMVVIVACFHARRSPRRAQGRR